MGLNPDTAWGMARHALRGRATGKPYDSAARETVTVTASNAYELYERGVVPPHPSSRNHGPIIATVCAWLAWGTGKMILTVPQWLDWFRDGWLRFQRRVGFQQNELNAGVYDRWMIGPARWLRALAILAGRQDVVEEADSWLRCWLLVQCLGAVRGESANLTGDQLGEALGGKPGVLVARGTRSPFASALTKCLAGERCYETKDSMERLAVDNLGAAEAARALRLGGDATAEEEAVRQRHPDRPELWAWPISDEERRLLLAAVDGDPQAAVAAISALGGGWWSEHAFELARWGGDEVATWIPELGGGSTCPVNATRMVRVPGGFNEVSILVANTGRRGTGADDPDLQPSRTTPEADGRELWTRRTSSIPYPDGSLHPEGARLPLPRGLETATLRVRWDREGWNVLVPAPPPDPDPEPQPDPAPGPGPSPKKRRRIDPRWIAGAVLLLALLAARFC